MSLRDEYYCEHAESSVGVRGACEICKLDKLLAEASRERDMWKALAVGRAPLAPKLPPRFSSDEEEAQYERAMEDKYDARKNGDRE